MVQAKLIDKVIYQVSKGWLIYVGNKEEEVDTKNEMVNPQLESLCERYIDIFSEVTGLSPLIGLMIIKFLCCLGQNPLT